MEKPYKPIPCGLYDEIEIAALKKKEVHIVFTTVEGEQKEMRSKILDTLTQGGAEYVVLEGLIIRMDYILFLEGKAMQKAR